MKLHALSFFALLLSLSAFSQAAPDLIRSEFSTLFLMKDLGLLDHPSAPMIKSQITSVADQDFVEIQLHHDTAGDVRLLLKGPPGFMTKGQNLRALMLVSGFFTGKESVRLLGQASKTVLVGFEYPYNGSDFQRDPGTLFQFVRRTPGQIALALKWLSQQSWLDSGQLNLIGVSLGGFLIPSGLHIAEKLGVRVSHSIFVCTGATMQNVLESNFDSELPAEISSALGHNLEQVFYLQDPRAHLPFLHGSFLVIRADKDQTIPPESTAEVYDSLPSPKAQVTVHGPHINVDQTEVILQVQNAFLSWLTPLTENKP